MMKKLMQFLLLATYLKKGTVNLISKHLSYVVHKGHCSIDITLTSQQNPCQACSSVFVFYVY